MPPRRATALERTAFVYVELSVHGLDDGGPPPCDAAGGHSYAVLEALFDAGLEVSVLHGFIDGGGYPRCGYFVNFQRTPGALAEADAGVGSVCRALYDVFADDQKAPGATFDVYGHRPPRRLPEPNIDCGLLDMRDRLALTTARGISIDLVDKTKLFDARRVGDEIEFYLEMPREEAGDSVFLRVRLRADFTDDVLLNHLCYPKEIDANHCAMIIDTVQHLRGPCTGPEDHWHGAVLWAPDEPRLDSELA